jgi:hypothetical protein
MAQTAPVEQTVILFPMKPLYNPTIPNELTVNNANLGVNYNQVVKHLKATFTEKMALAMLYRLEKATIELVTINLKIVELIEEFEEKWLRK